MTDLCDRCGNEFDDADLQKVEVHTFLVNKHLLLCEDCADEREARIEARNWAQNHAIERDVDEFRYARDMGVMNIG